MTATMAILWIVIALATLWALMAYRRGKLGIPSMRGLRMPRFSSLSRGFKSGMGLTIYACCVLIFLAWAWASVQGARKSTAEAERVIASPATNTYTPAQPQAVAQPAPIDPTGKTRYMFANDGCVAFVHLAGEWTDYPLEGEISFTDLSTGRVVLKHKAGQVRTSSLPAGNYRICKIDAGALGVDIVR